MIRQIKIILILLTIFKEGKANTWIMDGESETDTELGAHCTRSN